MKNNLLKLAAAMLVAFALSGIAKADPINGTISFNGSVTFDTASIPTATQVSAWNNAKVEDSSGDFASVAAGTATTFATPWVFSGSGPVLNFWSVGGFNFDLASWTIIVQGPVLGVNWLVIGGYGSASGNGFDATAGSFNFTTQDPSSNGKFSFSAGSAVPDGGTTALLVGLGLVGMSFIARRRK